MNEVVIKQCQLELVNKLVYFNICYKDIDYGMITLEIQPDGYVLLIYPQITNYVLGSKEEAYRFNLPEDIFTVKRCLFDFCKDNKIILDILRKKNFYQGEEFSF